MAYLDDTPTHDPPPPPAERARFRVPLGMPTRDEGRRTGAVVSILLHALIIGLLIIPFMMPSSVIERLQQGAGGAGPAGGGGGGRGGTGGPRTVESLRFVRLAPEPVKTPTTLPPVRKPPVPEVEAPKPKPVEVPLVKSPTDQALVPSPQATIAAALPGINGGSGRDGTSGAGPGTGGGIGAGAGTGTGSANGPGTGGGTQANYPPVPIEMFLPPLPPPRSVAGFRFVAEFDVDSTGRVLDFKFTQTRDGDYNRRLASVLKAFRFRPGTRPDGTPLRMRTQIAWDFSSK